MKLSQLKIEPQVIEAFIKYLKRNGYVVVPSKSDIQPFWINHECTPNDSHVAEIDKYGNMVIPERLHHEAINFLELECKPTTN